MTTYILNIIHYRDLNISCKILIMPPPSKKRGHIALHMTVGLSIHLKPFRFR